MGGAKDRLLPASVPFRFFVSATVFQVLFWAMLFYAADEVPGFADGLGPVLAAVHLTTLGVLAMTAMGATYQLLPVATRQPLARVWPTRLSYWLFMPGTLLLTWGMAAYSLHTLYTGAAMTVLGLSVFGILTADNLRRASSSLPVVALHGWVAMASLLGLMALAVLLIADFAHGFIDDPDRLALGHVILAVFGFMGMLVFGFSHVLIPMFALSRSMPANLAWSELALTTLALLVTVLGALSGYFWLLMAGAVLGLVAVASYLWLMRHALKTRMRKRLGLAFVLVRISWAMLALSVVVGLVVLSSDFIPNGIALFGFLALAGWMLTFLGAILQRIMPFLATMHGSGKGGKPLLLSDLTLERPLQIHAILHPLPILLLLSEQLP